MAALSMLHRHTLASKDVRAATGPMTQTRALCGAPLARQCNRFKPTAPSRRTRSASRLVVATSSTSDVKTMDDEPAMYADFIDEEALLAQSTFPIKPNELLAKAKSWLMEASEGRYDATTMADTFEFAGPVVGPLTKDEFLTAIASFDLKEGIPDLTGNMHHFRVDPYIHSRVWFTTISKGTQTGMLAGSIKPSGKAFQSCPQSCSLTFNEAGQVLEYTIGYPMDRRLGNTGGLGGVFGIFYAIGSPLPFPEANPWKISKRYRFFQLLGKLNSMMKK